MYRKRFSIYRQIQKLINGEESITLVKVADIWGKLRPLKANEMRVSGLKPEEFADMRLYCSPYVDIQFRDLIYDGEAYRVQSIVKRKGISEKIEIDLVTDPQAKVEING